jgi:type II secretory pathway pseudopilin PulG
MTSPRPNAFTLIETVLSLSIVGTIALATTSIVMLTSRAMPSASDADVANVNAREIASRIASELSSATSIAAVGTHSIIFSVPDRDGDDAQEVFRYRWSGTAGDPLMWEYNGGAAITVATNVTDFTLAVDTVSSTQDTTGPDAWGPEQLIYEHVGSTSSTVEIDGGNQVAQYVRPTCPSGTTGWTPTRAVVKLRRSATATDTPVLRGTFRAVIGEALPDFTKTQNSTYDASAVTSSSTDALVTFTAAQNTTFTPSMATSFILAPTLATTTTNSAVIAKATGVAFYPAYAAFTTNGLTWDIEKDSGLNCAIYGKFYGPTTTTNTITRATRASLSLRLGTADTATTTAQFMNRPATP